MPVFMALFLFSRLYFIQGALCQQEWRVPELLHRLLGVIESHLNHPYKNVRDRLGRYVLRLFESPYRTSRPSYLFRAAATLIVNCVDQTRKHFFFIFCSVLCSALMYDLNLPNCTQTQSPNRKEFVSKVLPQLTGLQELAREKEIMGGMDVSTENEERLDKEEVKDGSRESDERKEAIKRLKTSKSKVNDNFVRASVVR